MSEARRERPPIPESCGCGTGLSVSAPLIIDNRGGLSAVAYRIGDYWSFRETLLARLTLAGEPALERFTTRDNGDFTIGLLDAWAAVGDVLTFYQERIANEAYLGTATERLSLLEMARLIDYQLRPGVAASAWLAFTAEDPPGATRRLTPTEDQPDSLQQNTTLMGVPESSFIDAGVKVQSVPGPGETAQVYETIERIEARSAWNAMRPRLTTHQPITSTTDELLFEGLATGLKKGDPLLLSLDVGGNLKLARVKSVTLDETAKRTSVQLSTLMDAGASPETLTIAARVPGATAAKFIGKTVKASDFRAFARARRFVTLDVFDNLKAVRPPASTVFALRTRASIFGHNAPKYTALPAAQRVGEYAPDGSAGATSSPKFEFKVGGYANRSSSWVDNRLNSYHGEAANSAHINLDAVYANIPTGSWVVLADGSNARTYRVEGHEETSKSDFTLSAKISRLRLHSSSGFGLFGIRTTSIYGESEALALSRLPIEDLVFDDEIELESMVDGLRVGQTLAVCGELSDERGVTACEVVEIDDVEHDMSDSAHLETFTRIKLKKSLQHSYIRSTVTINGNVALATHGETVQTFGAGGETLGSGDASIAFQRFTLAQSPLTHVTSATSTGTMSTLEVRVNDVLWKEVSTLFDRGPNERVYLTEHSDDGKTSVIFGDGVNGARLPTGQGNVTARYRKGVGSEGRVAANQLTQLLTRPLGVKSVTNPTAADGGADPEQLEQARRNAPLGVLTLGRIVSLLDFEDFANAFTGIAKASAVRTRTHGRDGVFVTVAGDDGAVLSEGGSVLTSLIDAMRAAGDSSIALTVKPHVARAFRFSARIATQADLLRTQVLANVESALRLAFSFDKRAFGQPVHAAEVIAVIQDATGVTACALDELYVVPLDSGATIAEETSGSVHPHLPAAAPVPGTATPQAAELLLLDDVPLVVGVLT